MRDDIGNVTMDELAHYGTKGMKWGVRRKSGSDSSGGSDKKSSKDKPSSADIKAARQRTKERYSDLVAADQAVYAATTAKGRNAASKLVDKHAKEIYDSDDTRIANKLTKGEKIANVVIGGPIGVAVIASNNRATSKKAWDKHKAKNTHIVV